MTKNHLPPTPHLRKFSFLKTAFMVLLFFSSVLSQAQTSWTLGTSAADNGWSSVTYGNGLFVAVANSGTGNRVMTSPDGITWTSRTSAADNTWRSVVYGNGKFVAVSYDGTGNRVMTSPDGITWTSRTSAADNQWTSVTYGNGKFVAVAGSGAGAGKNVMTSPDGITWTLQTSALDNFWTSVTYGNGKFVAVAMYTAYSSGTRVMTSPDGITWTVQPTGVYNSWSSVTYGNGLFVAVATYGVSNRVMTSPDGITWTSRTSAADNQWTSVTYGNGMFVAVAYDGIGNRIMTSTDGLNWTIKTSPADNQWYSVAYGNGMFVSVASSGTGNRVMTSAIPTTPTIITQAVTSIAKTTATGNGNISALGIANPTAYGVCWNTSGTPTILDSKIDKGPISTTGAFTADITGLTAGTTYKVRAFATSSAGTSYGDEVNFTTLSNSDPSEWIIRTSAADNGWYSVTYGNGLFVAVANSGTGNKVMTSPDGITWTSRTSAPDNSWRSVVYGNGKFVAVSYDGTGNRVMTSPDGITWTSRTSAADNQWTSVTYGNGKFVAVAGSGAGKSVMTSPDGITWTLQTSASDNYWTSVTYGNGKFVAVAMYTPFTSGNRAMTSPDGITWTTQSSAVYNSWSSVTYGNGLFVAVAAYGASQVMTSPDGITWTSRTSAADNLWANVTFGNGMFVAVSNSGTGNRVMTSSDGINWTAKTTPADNNWNGVTYGNGMFVAVSSSGIGNRVMSSPSAPAETAPTVTTQAVTAITQTTATGNGTITDLGTANPTAYGVCWNTAGNPTITDSKTDKGAISATGAFTADMIGLLSGQMYHVRAFATNSVNTSYGAEVTFTTSETPASPTLTTSNGTVLLTSGNTTAVVIDPSATVSSTTNIDNGLVYINSGFVSSEDKIIYPANLYGVTATYAASTGVLTLTGTATAAQYQEIFRSIQYQNSNSTAAAGSRSFTFSLGDALPFTPCGATTPHYYQFVTGDANWTAAKAAAEAKTYFGMKGYLTTITCAEENDFAYKSIAKTGWIGASDSALEGDWKWVSGPEAGTSFYTGNGSAGGHAVGGLYNNWSTGGPNNWDNVEHYAHFFANGFWDDWADNNPVDGYFVEYGGMSGDPVITISGMKALNITLLVSNAPTVTTQAVTDIAQTTATGNGNITALGTANPTAYGVCWNTAGSPTITDSKTDKGAISATGAFTADMTGLTANTTYKVRAFATNSVNTSYGAELTFKTLPAPDPVGTANILRFNEIDGLQTIDVAKMLFLGFTIPSCSNYDLSELGVNIDATSSAGKVKMAIYNTSTKALLYQTTEFSVTGGVNEYASFAVPAGTLSLPSGYYAVAIIGNPTSGTINIKASSAPVNIGVATNVSTASIGKYKDIAYPTFLEPLAQDIVWYRAISVVVKGIDKSPTTATVSTTAISAIALKAASSGGNVSADGGAAVTARGVCWNTSGTPTIANSKTTDGSGIGVFSSNLTNLTTATTYYVRAYATNCAGTEYGEELTFTTASVSPPTALLQSSVVTNVNGVISIKPTVTGEGITFSISPALPAGVTFNAATGEVSGKPTALMAKTTYTLTATNAGGSVSIPFTIEVDPVAPTAAAAQAVCGSGTVADLVAVAPAGCTVRWYNSATIGTVLTSTTALTATTYYAESWSATLSLASTTRTAVALTINTVPDKPVIAGQSSATNKVKLCPNDYIVCSNYDSNLTYQWRKEGVDISGEKAGKYKVPASGVGNYALYVKNPTTGCENISATVAVTLYSVTIPVIYEKKKSDNISILIVDNTLNLYASYLWTYSNGTALPASIVNNRQFLVLPPSDMNATYMVNIIDNNACSASSLVKTVALKTIEAQVYPTLITDNFNVKLSGEEEGALNVKIFSQGGTQLRAYRFDNVQSQVAYQINSSDLKPGVYTVEVSLGNYRQTQNVIVK